MVSSVVVIPVGRYEARPEALRTYGIYDKSSSFFKVQAEVQVVFDRQELFKFAVASSELIADEPQYWRSVFLPVESALHLLGGQRRAVMELDALSQLECPG